MINNQKLSYKLYLKKFQFLIILKKVLDLKKLSKINYISNGDDYQVLFTASKNKRRIIKKYPLIIELNLQKLDQFKVCKKSSIIDDKNRN